MLKRFFDPQATYARRALRCMEDARMAALQHETAAEHHAALGKMYRQRVARLERELAPPPAAETSLILDPSTHPRVSPLRRNTDSIANSGTAGTQPFLAQGSAVAN